MNELNEAKQIVMAEIEQSEVDPSGKASLLAQLVRAGDMDAVKVVRMLLSAKSVVPPSKAEQMIDTINEHMGIIRMSGRAEYVIKNPEERTGTGPVDAWNNLKDARSYLLRCGLVLIGDVQYPGMQKPVKVDFFELWRTSPRADQYSGTTYLPGGPQKVGRMLNKWCGWGVKPAFGDKHKKFLELIKNGFCNGNLEYYEYVIAWLAHMVQKPTERPQTAIVIYSKQGTGKGTFTEVLSRMIGESNCAGDVSNKDLLGGFNSKLANKIMINVNEATFSGNHDQVEFMKKLVTDPTFRCEYKGYEPFDVPNYTRLIVTTNNINWGRLDPDDRRYLVLEPGPEYKENHEFFGQVRKDMFEDGGVANLFDFLLNYDISEWRPYLMPKRETGIDTLIDSLNGNSSLRFLVDLAGAGMIGNCDPYSPDGSRVQCGAPIKYGVLFAEYEKYCRNNPRLFVQSMPKFSQTLVSLGMDIRRSDGTRWVYILSIGELRRAFDENVFAKWQIDWEARYDGKEIKDQRVHEAREAKRAEVEMLKAAEEEMKRVKEFEKRMSAFN